MMSYMMESHGPWLAIKHGDEGLRRELSKHFGISGIPTLVIMKKITSGDWVQATQDGRGLVQSNQDKPHEVFKTISGN